MQRDHLFNRSTRPLLDSPSKSHYHAPTATIVQQQTKKPKPTIGSDYKLHGFNDFNFVANQYKNLSNTHTGYPYGSPPASPNASLRQQSNAYDDNCNGYSPYYDDDSGFHTNNSSENFSCRSNHSHSHSINYNEDSNDQYHNINGNHYQTNKETQSSQNTTHKKGGFFKDWPRFGGNTHHKITNSTNVNALQPSTEQHHHHQHQYQHQNQQQQYNCNKINSITPSPMNRLLDNGPFIFGVHSQTCYMLPSKVKNDSVIKHSTATSVLTTKYTPIDPDANDDDANDLYRRCDAAVIDDNAPSNNKRVLDTAATITTNGPAKEHDRRHIKNADKCRTKTEAPKKTKKSQKKSGNAIKCVVVGDEKVGKTNLILAYLQHRFTTEHVPTASDIYNFEVKVDENPVKVELADTAGQDFLDPLRRLCYPDTDVFLLCFSVIKPDTFVAVREKWAPIFRKTHKPIVLIGTQSDLRSDSAVISQLLAKNEKPVSKSDAWDYATLIGAKYIETSSRANTNVKEAFDTAIWHALVSVNEAKKPTLWKRLFCLT